MAAPGRVRSEDALSEIVVFVLVLALVVVASTLYLMYVVPAEGREDEITQMNEVQDRFVSYKTSVDGLWMRSLADLSVAGTRGVSLSTSFDLGTGGGNTQSSGLFLSFMRPIGTAANMRTQIGTEPTDTIEDRIGLRLNEDEYYFANDAEFNEVPVGSLSYHTDNYYWIQQNYIYKLGGVFLEQPGEGVSVKVAPPIAIYQVKNALNDPPSDAVKVSLSLVNITSPSSTVGGTGPLRVETRLRESVVASYRNEPLKEVVFWVYAKDEFWADAWLQVFHDLKRKCPVSNPDEWIDIEQDNSDPRMVTLHVSHKPGGVPSPTSDVFLDLSEATLQVTFEYDE